MKQRKNRLNNILKFGVFLFGISLLLWNCEKENDANNFLTESSLLEKLQQNFNPKDFKKTIPFNFDIEWNALNKQYSEELETFFYEFPIQQLSSKRANNKYYIKYNLIAKENTDKTFTFYIAKFFQEIEVNNNDLKKSIPFFNQKKGYKGLVHLYNNKGEMVFAKKVGLEKENNKKLFFNKELKKDTYSNRFFQDCYEVMVFHYTDHYNVWSIVDSDDIWVYTGSTLDNITTETKCDTYWLPELDPDGGNGIGNYTNPNAQSSAYENCNGGPHHCQYQINNSITGIDNRLITPCAKNIFNQLVSGIFTQHPLKPEVTINNPNILSFNLSENILSLFNSSQSTNYEIQQGNLSNNLSAHTIGSTTTMDNSYLANATDLSIARTMIHEQVHAYLNAIYYSFSGFVNIPFRDKMRQYAHDRGFTNINTFHHSFMNQYINAMAYSLYEWDKDFGTGKNLNNITKPDDLLGWNYYKSLAFGGLTTQRRKDSNGNLILDSNGHETYEDTDAFIALVPNSTERENIKQILNNEAINTNAQGTKTTNCQ